MFLQAQMIPYALKAKVHQELIGLERADVIEAVQYSDWAAPIVPVWKRHGSIRICRDYKVTVNRASSTDTLIHSHVSMTPLHCLQEGKCFHSWIYPMPTSIF